MYFESMGDRHLPKRIYIYTAGLPQAEGGAGGALAPPIFGQTVNPISTRGADYAHHITTSPPDFQTLRQPCTVYIIGLICMYIGN